MKSITINRITGNGESEEKKIYELPEEDDKKYLFLGQAVGINMNHCVILALKHKIDFWNCVYGYRIIQDEKTEKMLLEAMRTIKPVESYMTACFYERRATEQIESPSPKIPLIQLNKYTAEEIADSIIRNLEIGKKITTNKI